MYSTSWMPSCGVEVHRFHMHVLLVHGLGRTPLSLLRLGRDLRRAGHTTELVGYVAAAEPFCRIRRRVRRRMERIAREGRPYAGIGHSLGGLFLQAALAGWPKELPLPAHLIMLGSPHAPPRLASRFRHRWPYRLVNGQSGQLLARPRFFAVLPEVPVPYTVVVGTHGWRLMQRLFGGAANDGIVAVDEVRAAPAAEFVHLPVGHTFMMNDGRVRALVREILWR
jgi:hypothetical protein